MMVPVTDARHVLAQRNTLEPLSQKQCDVAPARGGGRKTLSEETRMSGVAKPNLAKFDSFPLWELMVAATLKERLDVDTFSKVVVCAILDGA
jgi:hypothetical protein